MPYREGHCCHHVTGTANKITLGRNILGIKSTTLEILSLHSFNLYYIKGKDIILSDLLSILNHDTSDPHDISPILFNVKEVIHAKHYTIYEMDKKIFCSD